MKTRFLITLALFTSLAYGATDRVLDGKFITNTGVTITLPTTTQTICGITETCTLTNKTITAPVFDIGTYTEAAAPGTPASGKVVLYAKADGLLYSKDDVGTETAVSGGGGGGATTALDNLAAVAINSSLLLDANNVYSLGDGTNQASVVNTSQVTSNAALTVYSTLDTDFYNATNTIGLYSDDNVSPMSLNFWNAAGTFKAGIKAPALAANYVLTLPVDDGTSGQVLATDGAGVLSWSSAGAGANQQLSNLSGTVAINLDLIFDTGAAAIVKTKNAAVASEDLYLISGNSSGSSSGVVTVSSGSAASGLSTGGLILKSGQGASTTTSGPVDLGSGNSAEADSGAVTISSGTASDASLTGASGAVIVRSGNGDAGTGNVDIVSGDSGGLFSGNLTLSTGIGGATGAVNLSTGGAISTDASGAINVLSGASVSGASGAVTIESGLASSSGATGLVTLGSGNSSTGNSGNVALTIGTAGGTQGQFVFLKTGVASVVGQVWTATGTGGQGYWATNSPAPSIVGTTGSPTLITAGGGVAFSGTNYSNTNFIAGNAGAVTVTANPQVAAATNVGQVLVLIGRHATNTVTLADGTGLSLNGSWVGGLQSVLTLQWDGTVWVETSRR